MEGAARELDAGFTPEVLLAALRAGDLPLSDQGAAYRRLLAWAGSIERLSAELGLNYATVWQRLHIFDHPKIGPAYIDGRLSLAEARALLPLADTELTPLIEQFAARRQARRPVPPAERARLIAAAANSAAAGHAAAEEEASRPLAALRRPDRTPEEEAEAYAALTRLGIRPYWIARKLGLDRTVVSRRMRVYADPALAERVLAGDLTITQAIREIERTDPRRIAQQVHDAVDSGLRALGQRTDEPEVVAPLRRARELLDRALSRTDRAADEDLKQSGQRG